MGKFPSERRQAEARLECESAERMVGARVALGYGGVKVLHRTGETFDLRRLIVRLTGLGFSWVVVANDETAAYYTRRGSRWDLMGIAARLDLRILAEGSLRMRLLGQTAEIEFVTVSTLDEGRLTEAMMDVLAST